MYAARKRLARRGIGYPEFEQNHSVAITSLFSAQPEKIVQNLRRGRDTPEKILEFNRRTAAQLRQLCCTGDYNKILISGEDIGTLDSAGVERLKHFFDPLVSGYRLIFYIRRPVSYINSAAQETIKGGARLEDLSVNPPFPHYRRRLEPFLDQFGKAAHDLRLYDGALLNGGLLRDFCTALGEPALSKKISSGLKNRSWSRNAVRIMSAFNTRYPLLTTNRNGIGSLNPDRPPDGVLRNVLQYVPGPVFALEPSCVAEVVARCQEDITWLEGIYGPGIDDSHETARSFDPTADCDLSNNQIAETVELLCNLCRHGQSDPKSAQSSCDALLQRYGSNPELWFQRGVALLCQSNFHDADAALRRTLDLDPEHFRAWNQLAVTRQRRGNLLGAWTAAGRSVALSPEADVFKERLANIKRQFWKQFPVSLWRQLHPR